MAGPVFISYSSVEAGAATRLCKAIEESGIDCWMAPRNIPAGEDWAASIAQAIEEAPAMILVMSRQAEKSRQVGKELGLASNGGKLVIPARIEGFTLTNGTFKYELSGRQWIDLHEDWPRGISDIVKRLQPVGATTSARPDDAQAATDTLFSRLRLVPSWRVVAIVGILATAGSAALIWREAWSPASIPLNRPASTPLVASPSTPLLASPSTPLVSSASSTGRTESSLMLGKWTAPAGTVSTSRMSALQGWLDRNYPGSYIPVVGFVNGEGDRQEFEAIRRQALGDASLMKTAP